MKKLKLTLCVAFLIVASYTGYTAYEKMTMTDAEKFMLENIEALTQDGEGGSGDESCVSLLKTKYDRTFNGSVVVCAPEGKCRNEFNRYADFGATYTKCRLVK